jgi:hypothetical protein
VHCLSAICRQERTSKRGSVFVVLPVFLTWNGRYRAVTMRISADSISFASAIH